MATVKLQPSGRTSSAALPAEAYSLDFQQLTPDNRILLTRPRFLLEGALDVAALQRTVEEIVARHSALGSRFVRDGDAITRYLPATRHHIPMEVVSFEVHPVEQHDARWEELFAHYARPFDVATGPLLRTALVRLGPDRHVLAFVIHHTVFDRGSMGAFVAELKRGYRAMTTGAAWPPPELQCIDLAVYLEAFAATPLGLKQRAYWDKTLAGVRPLELPNDHPRDALDAARDAHPRGMTFRPVGEVVSQIPAPLHAELVKLARTEKMSNYVVLLTALSTALHRARAQDDVTFQSTYSMRNRPLLAGMIGYVGNPIVMRVDLTGNPTFRELLARARHAVFSAWGNSDVPVIHRVPHGNRRFSFNYVPGVEGKGGPEELAPGVTMSPLRMIPEASGIQIPWDLHVWLHDGSERCALRFVYVLELFEQATVRALVDGWIAALREICEHPERRLAGG